MSESDESDWQQIEHNNDDKGIELSVNYSRLKHEFQVVVSYGEEPENRLSEQFNATHEPVFGMDIADQEQAYDIAEKLAQKLEHKLQL